jgi:hypothetical protein
MIQHFAIGMADAFANADARAGANASTLSLSAAKDLLSPAV